MSCEYFPATMNITWPVSINGSKKFMGILLNILCSPLFCFVFLLKKKGVLTWLLELDFLFSATGAYSVCPLCRGDVTEAVTESFISNS